MQIKSLTVKVEYRYDAGPTQPRWKALRARVMMVDSEGYVTYGSDLFKPTITNVDMVIAKSLAELKNVETVRFVFDEKMCGWNPRVYTNGRFVGEKMLS